MIQNLLFTLICFVAFTSAADAQIKVDGPREATVGYRVKAKLTLDVTDPIIKCIPENDDWYAVSDLAGNKFIDFVPGRASIPEGATTQTFTFIVAGSKAEKDTSKTFVEVYTVIVKHDETYVPPGPGPTPGPKVTDLQLYKDILAAYKVSPNASALAMFRQAFTEFAAEVKADKYSSASTAGQALAAKFKNKDLQSTRDVISAYLGATAGNTYNKAKLTAALDTICKVLTAVPE